MDTTLIKRVERLRTVKEDFNLDQQKIADYSGRSRTTVGYVFSAKDERYVTESNIAAIEAGIEKILAEYRQKLCGHPTN